MKFETEKVSIPLWIILTIGVLASIVAVSYWYYNISADDVKELGLAGGVLTGLIVYLATFLTFLRPIKELDHFHRAGIKALLANRHYKDYYRKLVVASKDRVDVRWPPDFGQGDKLVSL